MSGGWGLLFPGWGSFLALGESGDDFGRSDFSRQFGFSLMGQQENAKKKALVVKVMVGSHVSGGMIGLMGFAGGEVPAADGDPGREAAGRELQGREPEEQREED